MNQEEIDNCILYATTFQGSAIRTIAETLKECLSDTLVKFGKNGIRIIEVSTENSLITRLILDKFDVYHCTDEDNIGISMLSFYKLLKTVSNKDVVTLYIEKDDTTKLGILIQNSDKNTLSNIKMNLRDLDNKEVIVPDIPYDYTFDIPCSEFQKILRDLCIIDSKLKFYVDRAKNNMLVMKVEGDIGEQTTIIHTINEDNDESQAQNQIQEIDSDSHLENVSKNKIKLNFDNLMCVGMFNLHLLNLFFKASGICSQVKILLKVDTPILVQFQIANIGQLEFILSPFAQL